MSESGPEGPPRAPADWWDDDALWATLFPYMFPPRGYARAVEQAARVVQLTGVTGGRVLDLACGPGRHSVPLARLGFAVTGVDRTPYLLDRARAYAASEGVEVEWVRADMREFRRPGAFDLAVNLFTSFGYFADPADNQAVLARVHENLAPGGSFVIDLMGTEVLARIWQPVTGEELADGALLVQRRRVVDDWGALDNEWMLIREGTVRSFRFGHRVYAGAQLREMLHRAGFAEVRLYGGVDGTPYDDTAQRLVALARRAG